jgi:hypothetical protein
MITEEDCCEVEVADEREDHAQSLNIHHNIMKVRESGLFPSKTRNTVQ